MDLMLLPLSIKFFGFKFSLLVVVLSGVLCVCGCFFLGGGGGQWVMTK